MANGSLLYEAENPKLELCDSLACGKERVGRGVQEERDICIPNADSSMYGKSHHNIIK